MADDARDVHCDTCRWWRGPLRSQGERDGWGECLAVTGKVSAPKALAFVAREHDAGEDAWLETSPDFGCVQWQAKDGA